MTYPVGSAPDGSWQIGTVNQPQNLNEAGVQAIIRGQNLPPWQNAESQWEGKVSEFAGAAEDLEDSQLDMTDRLDLLDGVRGYCSVFMSKDWNLAPNVDMFLPFDTQLGPAKGAHSDSLNGIIIEEKGLWRADAHVSFAPAAGWTGTPIPAQVLIDVKHFPSLVTYSFTRYDIVITATGAETAHFSKTFVIPDEPDKFVVVVRAQHQRNQRNYVYGGTVRSGLSVNKWDNRADNAVVMDSVPDGGLLG